MKTGGPDLFLIGMWNGNETTYWFNSSIYAASIWATRS